jgi:hypothetical protein
LTLNGLHGVISQKIVFFITTGVRTSNPTYLFVVYFKMKYLASTAANARMNDGR